MARQLNKRLSASDKKHSSRSSTRHHSQEATTSTASTTAETGDEQKDIKIDDDDGNADIATVRLNDSDTRKRQQAPNGSNAETECWQKTSTVEEKSREEEFDEYLEDLLL